MKNAFSLIAANLALLLGAQAMAAGSFGSTSVFSCSDVATGNVVELVRASGLTGGRPGSLLATVTKLDGEFVIAPTFVTRTRLEDGDQEYSGPGFVLYVPAVQLADLPFGMFRATLTLGDGEGGVLPVESTVLCSKQDATPGS